MSSAGESLNPGLIEVLACPRCPDRPALHLEESSLKCNACGAMYPIQNGIPHLLPEDATFEVESTQ